MPIFAHLWVGNDRPQSFILGNVGITVNFVSAPECNALPKNKLIRYEISLFL